MSFFLIAFSKSEEETEPSHWGYDLDDGKCYYF